MGMRLFVCVLVSVGMAACSAEKKEPPAPAATTEAAKPPAPTVPLMPAESFAFSAQPSGKIPPMAAGSVTDVKFVFKNESPVAWPAKALSGTDKGLFASYHILDTKGVVLVFDGVRTPITDDVPPGGEVVVVLKAQAPEKPGRYQIQPDVVQETVVWFGVAAPSKKNPPVAIDVTAAHR